MAYNKLLKLSDNIEAVRLAFEAGNGKLLTDDDRIKLRKYSGFGGLKFVLYPEGSIDRWRSSDHPYYEKTQELWKLLRDNSTDEAEYRRYVSSIRNSVLTSFYTPEPVVGAISSALKENGLKIERFLEPSSGNGIFIDKFEESHPGVKVTSFEKDLVTGKVLAALHQDADVHIEGFETIDSSLRGTFDVSASNIPFGDMRVFDPMFSNSDIEAYKVASGSIHNYFFLKAMQEVRNGGIIAFITSRGVLDSEKSRPVRQVLVESANLVGVVRLPDGMFREEAGTDVGSDLVILQRNDSKNDLTTKDKLFVDLKPSRVADDVKVNGLLSQGDYSLYTDLIVGKDPYGKKALVYKYEKPIEELGQELHDIIKNDLAVSLDKELYDKGIHVEEPKNEEAQQPQKPQRPKSAQPVQLTLFDFFDEAEEQNSLFEPRPFSGPVLAHYRDGIFVKDNEQIGVLSQVNSSNVVFTPKDLDPYQSSMLSQYILVRDAYEDLYRTEAELQEPQENLRHALNRAYDEFVNRYGIMNSRKNSKTIFMDLLGRDTATLENASADGKSFTKADIFTRPVSFTIDEHKEVTSAIDALAASLNRSGTVDLQYMSAISGIDVSELKEELKERIFYNPAIGQGDSAYEISDKFLAGNIIEKLEEFKNFTSDNEEEAIEIERSRAALEEVKPVPIAFEDLDFNFGERWMPKEYFSEFASQLFDVEVTVEFAPHLDEFVVKHSGFSPKADEEYAVTGETKTYDGFDLLRYALYNTVPTIQKVIGYTSDGKNIMGPDHEKIQLAASKIDQIRDEFNGWVDNHPKEWKENLADMYNRKFNCFVRAKYDGSHQTFPDLDLKGLADSKYKISSVYKSQKDCVWMLLQNGGGICDHEVGTGKTLIMCITAHEMKRLGLAHKPIIIGMKANVAEIAATYQTAYPNDRILYASSKDFKDRENFFNRMKNNDYDCIIMSHDQFTMIPQSPEIQKTVMEEELYALEEALEVYRKNGGHVSGKMLTGLEKRKENLEVQLSQVNYSLSTRADDVSDFKTMGIDHILVDESQVFKNLAFTTRDNRVAGLGDPKGSQRARNLQYAIRTIQQRTGKDLGATFLSGTTISNSLTELYLLFKYLRPKAMAKQDINSFDSWASVYARKNRDYELNVAGSVVMKERFRRFIKVPELAAFYNEITDYRTANDVGLERPDMSVKLVNLEPTEAHKDFSQRLIQFAQNGDGSLVFRSNLSDSEQKAKMLLVTNMGKKASLSPKLVNMDYEEGDHTKIGVAASNIAEYYRKYDEYKGTQFVFCDLSTPKKDEWNAYQELKDRLVNQYGIPADEIGFIQDAGTEKKKQEYIAKMNRGEIRVMVGSTTMLGTGVNAQERAVAIHHLDLPWRPSDMEQRNGRARRKGNEVAKLYANNNVDCFVYAVERSLDSYNFYLLQAKSEFIRQMKTGSLAKRSFDQGGEDEDNGMPFAEYVAITSGNTDLLERAKLEKRILGLESEKKAFLAEQRHVEGKLAYSRTELKKAENILVKLKEDLQVVDANSEKDNNDKYINALQLNGYPGYHTEEEKGAFIQNQARRLITEDVEIGHIFGFPVVMRPKDFIYEGKRIGNQFFVKGSFNYTYSDGFVNMSSRVAAATYALTAITKIPSLIERYEKDIERYKKDIPELERISGKQWTKTDMLTDLKEQLVALDRKIQQDIDINTMEASSSMEEAPFKIEQKSWGRQPWLLTFKVSDYPFISLMDAKAIGDKYRGYFHVTSEWMEGNFCHQYGAQEAIKELSKLNAERLDDIEWLKETAQKSDDTGLRAYAIKQLKSKGLDRFGNSIVFSDKPDCLRVVALADYNDVRLLAHGVKDGHTGSLQVAASALAQVIKNMPEAENAILVPMPGHNGDARQMSMLTVLIERLTGIESVEVLQGTRREELYQWKKEHPGEALPEVLFVQDENLRAKFEGKTIILVDNVLDTGHTAWAAMDALEKAPVLLTLGTTGNHAVEGHRFDVKVSEQGLHYINEARPEGVGFTGMSQEEFDLLLKRAKDSYSGAFQNMHNARRLLRNAGYDYHTGRPIFEVSSIVLKWDLAYDDVLIPAMKDAREKIANDELFTSSEKRFIQHDKIAALVEKMEKTFVAPDQDFIEGWKINDIQNVFIDYEVMKMDAALAVQKEHIQSKEDISSKNGELYENIARIGEEDSKKILDLLFSRGTNEVRLIIFLAEKNNQLLKAPNGEPTQLSPVQWVYVRTEEFRNFFGESKALNEDLEPLNLYHGALTHGFATFKNEGNGIYFTPKKAFAQTYGANDMNPYRVFVKMNNPLIVDFDGDIDNEETEEHHSLEDEYLRAVESGYDGVIAYNTFDGENEMDQYVVHNPEDIMLADDASLLERMGVRFSEEEQRTGNLRLQKHIEENSSNLKYEINSFDAVSHGIEAGVRVDFGIEKNVLRFASPADLKNLADELDGTVMVVAYQNNRLIGEFPDEQKAKEYAESVQALYSDGIRQVANSMRDRLIDVFKESGINVKTDPSEADKVLALASGSQKNFKTLSGEEVYGFVYKDEMYVDTRIASLETPLHEYTHLWTEVMRQRNPEEWRNIVNILKGDSDLWNKTKDEYSELKSDDDIADEVLAQYSGRRGAEKIMNEAEKYNAPDSSFAIVSQVLEKLWRFVADFLHIHYESKEQIADQVLKDALAGVNPLDYKRSYGEIQVTHNIKAGDMTYSAEESESLRLQKAISTVNKVSWQGNLDVYSSSKYLPIRALTHGVKQGKPEAIEEASVILAKLVERIPDYKDAVLVPIPNRSGNAEYTLELANRISKELNLPVADILTGNSRKPLYSRKENNGNDGLKLMRYATKGEIPSGKRFVLVDNVLDTGTTAMSAMRTLGDSTSLVVLGSTNNSQKYNYPIDIHVFPVTREHLSKARVENIRQSMIDYYTEKYSNHGIGVGFKDLIRTSELQDWQGVASTARKMEIVLYSNSRLSEEEKNSRISNGSSEALAFMMKSESLHRLVKDLRSAMNGLGVKPKTEGWVLNIRDIEGHPMVANIPVDKDNAISIMRSNTDVDILTMSDKEFNHFASELVNHANAFILATYLSQTGKDEEIGKMNDVLSVSLDNGNRNRIYAFRIKSEGDSVSLSFGNYMSDVISGKTVSFDTIKDEEKGKVMDAVLDAVSLSGEKKVFLENYVVESNYNIEKYGLRNKEGESQIINTPEVKQINNSVMDEKDGKTEEKQDVNPQEATAQTGQQPQKPKYNSNDRWKNLDYSKYHFPEGVEVKDVNVYKTSVYDSVRKATANRYKITATINGVRRDATMLYNDVSAFFEKDDNGHTTRRVSALALAAKYFAKDYVHKQDASQTHAQDSENKDEKMQQEPKQDVKSLGSFEIPVYAVPYFVNGTDALDGLEEEDVNAITDFEKSLPANVVFNWPENIDDSKYFTDQPTFGKASEVVRVEIFQIQETQDQSQEQVSQSVEEPQVKNEQKFSSVLLLKDDDGNYALYAKPENDKPFAVYATPEDVDRYFSAFNDASDDKKEVHLELAGKYYDMVKSDPSVGTTAVFKSNATPEDLARISSANVFRTKEKIINGETIPSKTMMTAVIDGTKQEAREITEIQMRNTFLAPDANEYKAHLAFKVYGDILHPELKEEVTETADNAEVASETETIEEEKKEEVKISKQAELLTKALEASVDKEGIWMNEDCKKAPTLLSSKSPISAFNSMVMALNSDQNGYKTNVYTSFSNAKNAGFSVRSGQSSIPFNWFEWDRYANKFNSSDVIDKNTYEALPQEEKEMYRLAVHKDVQTVFNIDQTLMKQQKPDMYKDYVAGQENREQAFRQLMTDVKESVSGFSKDVLKTNIQDTDTELYIEVETEKGERFFGKFEKDSSNTQYFEVNRQGVETEELSASDFRERLAGSIATLKEEHPEAGLSPIMRQYLDLKKKHPDAILLFRNGDFYETYKDDAEKASSILGITLTRSTTTKDDNGKPLALAGFPYHALETYLPKLIRAGQRIAICDVLENPRQQNQQYGTEGVIYDKLDKITEELKSLGAETSRVEPSHFKNGVLTVDINRRSESGKELETALERANDLYRSVAAYTFTEDRLNIGAKSKMLPEDVDKYNKLVQELSAGVLMAKQGYPARLSSEARELVPYWTRELREDPSLIDKVENDVNNVVKAANEIMKGQAQNVDYERMRGDKTSPMLARDYSIVTEINRHPSLDEKHMVLIKDNKSKSVDVILPEGASLKMGEDIKGMNKNRIVLALTKEGFDGEKVSWYNAQGGLALKQPNEYFEGKKIEVARLKQYTLIPISTIDVSGELKRNGQVQFDKVQMIRDDEGHWALYVAPQKDQGEAFAIYPEPKDIKRFFETLKTDQASTVGQELGQKYLLISKQHPELKATFMTPEVSDEQLLSRITRVEITQNKKKENSIVMWATIDGKTQPPKELTREQYQRFFLVNDQEAYKLALATKLFSDKLNVNIGEGVKQEQDQHQEQSQQVRSAEKQKTEENAEETRSRGIHV